MSARTVAHLVLAAGLAAPAAGVFTAWARKATSPPAARPKHAGAPPASRGGAALIASLGCAACHPGAGSANDARAVAPSTITIARRRSPGYVFAYLADSAPGRGRTARARMPDFHLEERERLALALYLDSVRDRSTESADANVPGQTVGAKRLDAAFTRVRRANPRITATTGERIFIALNCAGCHEHPTITPWLNAPDLAAEGSRVRSEWLRAFLARPHAVRPSGIVPGTGGRMPDFRLTPSEVDSIASYLEATRAARPTFEPRPLSAFARHEAETLLREKLPCLGCHQLGGEGGRLAPDLSAAPDRLQPAYIQAMVRDPQHTAPWAIMPRVAMPARTVELIASFLAQYRGTRGEARYLSLVDTPIGAPIGDGSGAALYQRICAHCHGTGGQGDGWNARYLPVRPTAHADATQMSERTDDTIYDGIAAGGYILGRSNRMPGFGDMLSPREIRSLVAYIRELCRCAGPAWSRDGGDGREQ